MKPDLPVLSRSFSKSEYEVNFLVTKGKTSTFWIKTRGTEIIPMNFVKKIFPEVRALSHAVFGQQVGLIKKFKIAHNIEGKFTRGGITKKLFFFTSINWIY
jgi:hypothetical protein